MLNAKIIELLKARQLFDVETKLDDFLARPRTSEARRQVNGKFRVELYEQGACVAHAESAQSFTDAASHATYALGLWLASAD